MGIEYHQIKYSLFIAYSSVVEANLIN